MKRRGRPYSRSYRGRWMALVAALVVVVVRLLTGSEPAAGPESLAEGMHAVRRVVDGDTLLLESGARVRLQGIDSPETVKENSPVEKWGPEASQFTKDFVDRAGGRLCLTFSEERLDRYDRFLAFAWHGDELLNEELVRAGLARAQLQHRYSESMKRRFARAEEEARRSRRGIWSGE